MNPQDATGATRAVESRAKNWLWFVWLTGSLTFLWVLPFTMIDPFEIFRYILHNAVKIHKIHNCPSSFRLLLSNIWNDEIEPTAEVVQEEKAQASVVGWVQPPSNSLVFQFTSMAAWWFGNLGYQSYLSHLSFYASIFLTVCLPVYLFIYSSNIFNLSVHPSIYQPISLSINLPTCLPTDPCIYLI